MNEEILIPAKVVKKYRELYIKANDGDEDAKRAMALIEKKFPGTRSAAITDAYLQYLAGKGWPEASSQQVFENIQIEEIKSDKFKYVPTKDLLAELRMKRPELFEKPMKSLPKRGNKLLYVVVSLWAMVWVLLLLKIFLF